MRSFQEKHVITCKPEDVFNVVADVERYPDFVPMCEKIDVLHCENSVGNVSTLLCKMHVGYNRFQEAFICHIILDRNEMRIDVESHSHPFKEMRGVWSFEKIQGDACLVNFKITCDFKNRLLDFVAGKAFKTLLSKMVSAFDKRVQALNR